MFASLATFTLALASFAPLVAAHGTIAGVIIDGKRWDGPLPFPDEQGGPFAIRQVNSVDPVKGTSNRDINCGRNAQKAELVADAGPGSTVEFIWRNGEGGTWVHNTGPVMTYMAPCGAGGCANFDPANAQFFKISELGKKPDGNWFMRDLTNGPNASLSVRLPETLPAGEYLIRHELIAMQLGGTFGGAEFYPACVQVRLSAPTRTGADVPAGVTFPGAYSDSDPGIHTPDIYNPGLNYIFPGPPVIAEDVNTNPSESVPATPSSSSGSESGSETPAPSPSPSPSPAPAPAPCAGSGRTRKRRVYKRIIAEPVVKRSGSHLPPVANVHRREIIEERPLVRSRMMRAI